LLLLLLLLLQGLGLLQPGCLLLLLLGARLLLLLSGFALGLLRPGWLLLLLPESSCRLVLLLQLLLLEVVLL
jgi:hypothetical protein